MKIMDDIASLHEANYPGLIESRRGTVTNEQLEDIWSRVGRVIPELADLLKWRDGEDADSFLLGCAWQVFPIEILLARYDAMVGQEISIESDFKQINGIEYWPSEWIPFVEWNYEVMGVIDCRQEGMHKVIGVDLGSGYAVQWAVSVQDFFDGALRDLKTLESLSIDRLMRSVEKP